MKMIALVSLLFWSWQIANIGGLHAILVPLTSGCGARKVVGLFDGFRVPSRALKDMGREGHGLVKDARTSATQDCSLGILRRQKEQRDNKERRVHESEVHRTHVRLRTPGPCSDNVESE